MLVSGKRRALRPSASRSSCAGAGARHGRDTRRDRRREARRGGAAHAARVSYRATRNHRDERLRFAGVRRQPVRDYGWSASADACLTLGSSSFSSHHFSALPASRGRQASDMRVGLGRLFLHLLAHQPARGDGRRGHVRRQKAHAQARPPGLRAWPAWSVRSACPARCSSPTLRGGRLREVSAATTMRCCRMSETRTGSGAWASGCSGATAKTNSHLAERAHRCAGLRRSVARRTDHQVGAPGEQAHPSSPPGSPRESRSRVPAPSR